MRVKLVIKSTIDGASVKSVIKITICTATLTSPVPCLPSKPIVRCKGSVLAAGKLGCVTAGAVAAGIPPGMIVGPDAGFSCARPIGANEPKASTAKRPTRMSRITFMTKPEEVRRPTA